MKANWLGPRLVSNLWTRFLVCRFLRKLMLNWCCALVRRSLLPGEVVAWTGSFMSRREALGIKLRWSYAPAEVKVLTSADGRPKFKAAKMAQELEEEVAEVAQSGHAISSTITFWENMKKMGAFKILGVKRVIILQAVCPTNSQEPNDLLFQFPRIFNCNFNWFLRCSPRPKCTRDFPDWVLEFGHIWVIDIPIIPHLNLILKYFGNKDKTLPHLRVRALATCQLRKSQH